MVVKLKIADFRSAIESLDWARCDLNGATAKELLKTDVKTRLGRHIDALEKLIPDVRPRFGPDIYRAREAIEAARKRIVIWEEAVAASKNVKAPQQFEVTIVAPGMTNSRIMCDSMG